MKGEKKINGDVEKEINCEGSRKRKFDQAMN